MVFKDEMMNSKIQTYSLILSKIKKHHDFNKHPEPRVCTDICAAQLSAMCVTANNICFAGDTLFVSSLQTDNTDVFMCHLYHAGSHNRPSGLSLLHSPRLTARLCQTNELAREQTKKEHKKKKRVFMKRYKIARYVRGY